MDDEIRSLIQNGEIGALALDTSMLRAAGYAFERGLLEQVAHLRAHGITVLLPDIVMHETRAHLLKEAALAVGKLRGAVEDLDRKTLTYPAALATLISASDAACVEAQERPAQRVKEWIAKAGISVVDAGDFVQVEDLIALYVAGDPPFTVEGKKKSEFPDAFALLALKGWAENNDTRVLAVSSDDDWKRFGESSSAVYVVQDLGAALSAFQTPNAANVCRALFMSVDDGDPYGLEAELLKALDKGRDRLRLRLELDETPYAETIEAFSIEFSGVELPEFDHGSDEFKPVSHDSATGKTVVEIAAWASAVISWQLSLSTWDKAKRQSVTVGGGTYRDEQQFEFKALITVAKGSGDLKIMRVEIEPTTVDSFLDEVTPQWYGDASV
ncbi:PIN domain-containing protein [Burkholderia sp. BCC0419]|uniref:PIN domain-containing protein n=1 Tax=Burkholderia sp. BCC0419 TaxID=486878 RepID=UPI00158CD6D5|nr:PIN domain-containing protein [Burkholderia sp. BCC0419]